MKVRRRKLHSPAIDGMFIDCVRHVEAKIDGRNVDTCIGLLCLCIAAVKWVLSGKSYFAQVNTFILLIASYVFMAVVDLRYCVCILLLTMVVYYSALQIEKGNAVWLRIAVVLSILQLAVFKYLNFFADSLARLLGSENVVVFQLLIPIGVSFYTFSGISYLVDVHRSKVPANRNFAEVALYIAFFPKLTSGPIVRAKYFFTQLDQDHSISWNNFAIGIQIFVYGLFKKMVLADHLSIFVDDVFSAPMAFTGATVVLATIAYGHGLIQERNINTNETVEFEVSGDKIEAIYMIPGWTHNIINLSETEDLVTVMTCNESFDPNHPDTFFEPV